MPRLFRQNASVPVVLAVLLAFVLAVLMLSEGSGTGALSTSMVKTLGMTTCLSIVALAMTLALSLYLFQNDTGLRGNDGLSGLQNIPGAEAIAQGVTSVLFLLASVAVLALAYVLAAWMMAGKFGNVTRGIRDDEGRVLWGEKSVSLLGLSEAQIARAGVGRKFQRPTEFEDQSVRDNLMVAVKNDRRPFAVLFWRPTTKDHDRVQALATEIGLADHLDRQAGILSHGQKQWLEIGMLLAQQPRLLLVDEQAAGMTGTERDHTTLLLKEAAKTRAAMVVEHDMDFVRKLDCKVAVLHEGSVLAEGSLDHVTANQQVIDVYLGR